MWKNIEWTVTYFLHSPTETAGCRAYDHRLDKPGLSNWINVGTWGGYLTSLSPKFLQLHNGLITDLPHKIAKRNELRRMFKTIPGTQWAL